MGVEAQQRHESLYRRTVRSALDGIRTGEFTEQGAAGVVYQLEQELGQCIELLLISPEFYTEQMGLLQTTATELAEG